MKKIIVVAVSVIVLCLCVLFFVSTSNQSSTENQPQNQIVLEQTYNISREYVALRYRTDNMLVNARSFVDYVAWKQEMEEVMRKWEVLETEATNLENSAQIMAQEKVSFTIISQARAYDRKEISDVFDNAPAGKKIATLANHLGVDAKRAFKILQQDQAQVEADGWNEAGDTFQKLETSATVIKDGCKVVGFIGGIAVTGGASALAAGSSLAKAAVVISGADLTLEITDDGAKIAFGNHNKISAIVNDVRKATEPIATLLTISDIPNNLTKDLDKFNAVMVAMDQFRGAAQEGKIIGIELPVYKKEQVNKSTKIAVLEKAEIEKWLEEQGAKLKDDDIKNLDEILNITNRQAELKSIAPKAEEVIQLNSEKQTNNSNDNNIIGAWSGILQNTAGGGNKIYKYNFLITFKDDGTLSSSNKDFEFFTWKKQGDDVMLYGEDPSAGYYQFKLSGYTLTLIKTVLMGTEYIAGEAGIMGGKALEGSLQKQ